MDPFEFKDQDIQPTRSPITIISNVLTVLFLISAVCIGVVFATIFINPYVPYNPFPPPTLPARSQPPTANSDAARRAAAHLDSYIHIGADQYAGTHGNRHA